MKSRRCISGQIAESDAFLEMPLSSQALYFHLHFYADSQGFIGNPKAVTRTIGAAEDDLKLLIGKKFLIPFESGVVVIKHWNISNSYKNDRNNETTYLEEKGMLRLKPNKAYTMDENYPTLLDYKEQKNSQMDSKSFQMDSKWKDFFSDSFQMDSQTKPNQTNPNQIKSNKIKSIKSNQTETNLGSVCLGVSDDEWEKLDSIYEDLRGLIDFVDESKSGEIRNPYKYIIAVAENHGWPKK